MSKKDEVIEITDDKKEQLLNEAVNRLMAQKDYQDQNEVLMELEYTGFIPDTYITSAQIKMEIYKKIAAITTQDEFEAVLSELDDRFGPIPDEVSSLLADNYRKLKEKSKGIVELNSRKHHVPDYLL